MIALPPAVAEAWGKLAARLAPLQPWLQKAEALAIKALALEPVPAPPADASPLARLADSYPLPSWRPLARVVTGMVALFLLWALFARLDEVAVATGEVVPESKVKVIQHLEGGIVREISVHEGAMVREGDPLVQLDLPVTALNREELRVRLDGLILQRARLEAEVADKPVTFPAEEAGRHPQLVLAERRSFEARRDAFKATIAVLNQQMDQKRLEIQELETRSRALSTSLATTRQRYDMATKLMQSGLTSKMEHAQLSGQVQELEGQLAVVRASLPRAQAAQTEAQRKIEEEKAKFIRTAQAELATAELDVARNSQLLSQASDQQLRTQITSPTDGFVKNLRVNTIGGVIRAGDPIMEIVPLHDRLMIEAKLSPTDRGYVQIGQHATVKVSAYDYTTYGGLEGTVTLVAADTTVAPETEPYYQVRVETERSWIGTETAKRPITAGMQATVEIHTGTRTVMEYLVKPVLKMRHEAFRER
jgi:adhesin transport system membrane fusion protein